MTTQHEQDVIAVLEHIKKYPCGYMGALKQLNKPNVVNELKTLGILKSGHTHNAPTYAVTTFGRSYIATLMHQKAQKTK